MSHTNLKYHYVFATKGRQPVLDADLMPRLNQYMGGVVRALNGKLLDANGPTDHLHLAVQSPPTITVADMVSKIKSNSSRWIHETFPRLSSFDWQDGYAAFTVSQSGMAILGRYSAIRWHIMGESSFKRN